MGHVGEHERARGRPVRRRDDRRLQPLRRALGHALLEERLALRAVGEALHEGRPPTRGAQERLGDRQVVAHEVELRLPALREEHLVRARHRDGAPGDVEQLVVCHRAGNGIHPASRAAARTGPCG